MKKRPMKQRAPAAIKQCKEQVRAKAAELYARYRSALRACAGALALAYLVIQGSQLHYRLIRSYVGSKVYYVTESTGRSGGTGVHVIAPSGKTYLLTNAHVCEMGENGYVWISDGKSRLMPRRIIENSVYTDLCLIEPIAGESGLSVANNVSEGEIVAAIGHPRLQPLTMTQGEIVSEGIVTVLDYEIESDAQEAECNKPKQRVVKIPLKFFGITAGEARVCVVDIHSYLTTVVTLGGSSGSPVVNWKGEMIGLVFAGDRQVHWSAVVHLDDLKEFLKPY